MCVLERCVYWRDVCIREMTILDFTSSHLYFRVKVRLHEFFNLDKDLCEEDYKTVRGLVVSVLYSSSMIC